MQSTSHGKVVAAWAGRRCRRGCVNTRRQHECCVRRALAARARTGPAPATISVATCLQAPPKRTPGNECRSFFLSSDPCPQPTRQHAAHGACAVELGRRRRRGGGGLASRAGRHQAREGRRQLAAYVAAVVVLQVHRSVAPDQRASGERSWAPARAVRHRVACAAGGVARYSSALGRAPARHSY
jgi:hypothetical protein